MQFSYALLYDAANISQEGSLNVLGAFTELYAEEFPYDHPSMSLAVQIEFSPDDEIGEYLLTGQLIDPDGGIAYETPISFEVGEPAESGRAFRMYATEFLDNVNHPSPGDYEFRIMYQQEIVSVVPYVLNRF